LARNHERVFARIAAAGGWSDQPHFNREFRCLLGMSPGDFVRYAGCFHDPGLPIWQTLNQRIWPAGKTHGTQSNTLVQLRSFEE
jgi:AraC-like DNA-binding protein